MRTQDPTSIRTDFLVSINDVESAHNAVEAGVQEDGAKKLVTEYLFVASAALLEGYVSDLFVAYINRTSEKFREHLLSRMQLETEDEYAKRSVPYVETAMPHLTVDRIREILDPTGFNVTFYTTADMKGSAGKWLADADKVRFTGISSPLCAFIDFVKAVRNYLAHRSQSADDKMQVALVAADLPAELRRPNNNVQDVGVYLRAMQNNQRRFKHTLGYMRTLSAQLCP